MTEPRILMTCDAVGGVWVFAVTLARALAERGARVRLVNLGLQASASRRAMLAAAGNVDLHETGLELEWRDPRGRDRDRAARLLPSLARDFRADVVHVNGYREAAFEWPAPVLLTAHSCVISWWEACRGGRPAAPEWACYAANVRAGIAAADAWTAPSAAMAREVDRLYAPPRPGNVIYNGIAPPTVAIPPAASRAGTILAVGRLWDEAKGIDTLAAAASRLPWPTHVVGPDHPGNERTHIVRLGELAHDRVAPIMARSGIFAAPARYEPFGLAVLEAAATGAPLVLSDIATFRELWSDAAAFVPPGDADALAATLAALIADPPRRRALGAAARRRAAAYPLARMADAYLRLYRALAGIDEASAPPRPQPVHAEGGTP